MAAMQLQTQVSAAFPRSRHWRSHWWPARLLDWRLGQVPGAVRGYGGKAKANPPDAIGPARFPGARLIEANRYHPRGILSGAALFIGPTECISDRQAVGFNQLHQCDHSTVKQVLYRRPRRSRSHDQPAPPRRAGQRALPPRPGPRETSHLGLTAPARRPNTAVGDRAEFSMIRRAGQRKPSGQVA